MLNCYILPITQTRTCPDHVEPTWKALDAIFQSRRVAWFYERGVCLEVKGCCHDIGDCASVIISIVTGLAACTYLIIILCIARCESCTGPDVLGN